MIQEIVPPEGSHRRVKDNPSKPYKAMAAAAVPGIIALLTVLMSGEDILPPWALLLISAALAFVATYSVKNPKVKVPRE